MDEIMENQALEDQEVPENGGQGEAVDPQSEQVDEGAAGQGEGASQEEPGDAGREDQQPPQSHQDNAAARAARIRAEQETTARLQKQFDEEVAAFGIPNPYTGKPFGSFQEFKAYGEQFRREKLEAEAKKQGKTVEELQEEQETKSWAARKRREEKEQREAMAALERQKAFLRADLETFLQKFPGVDPGKLEQNAKFKKFAGKRLYKEPLSELYADFCDLVSDAERAAVAKATGKAARSTGGGQGGGMDMLTPEQREALEEWNKARPEKKMTAKQFLEM